MSKSPRVTPLLTDEELDALIQAFNRRESTPGLSVSARASLVVLTLSLIGLAGWW